MTPELKQRTSAAVVRPAVDCDASSSISPSTTPPSFSPPLSTSSSSNDLGGTAVAGGSGPKAANSKGKSLAERSQIPSSFLVTFGTILGLQCASGMWTAETLQRWCNSLHESALTGRALLIGSTRQLLQLDTNSSTAGAGSTAVVTADRVKTALIAVSCAALFYVFFVAPFMAGLWTGRKARRHKFHRYMGLSYLIHYVLAWIEFFTNYEGSAKSSYLCHVIAVHGMCAHRDRAENSLQ
jgi:hypothetical protein